MLSEEDICLKFFNNDKLDPLTNKLLNKKDYYKYVNLCKKQGIFVSPIHSYRYVQKQPLSNLFKNKDLLHNIMLNMSNKDIKTLCTVNKTAFLVCNDKQFWIDKKNIQTLETAQKINKFIMGNDPNYLSPNKSYIIFDDDVTLKHYYGNYYVLKTLNGSKTINKDIINVIIDLLTNHKKYTVIYYLKEYKEYDFFSVYDLDMFLDDPPKDSLQLKTFSDDFDEEYEEESFNDSNIDEEEF